MSNPEKATWVDQHIGNRIRERRMVVGMSQGDLGASSGVSYQQIQRYESGSNRVSVARLWEFCKALDVPPTYFFTGLESDITFEGEDEMLHRNILVISRMLQQIDDPLIRHSVIRIVRQVSELYQEIAVEARD